MDLPIKLVVDIPINTSLTFIECIPQILINIEYVSNKSNSQVILRT